MHAVIRDLKTDWTHLRSKPLMFQVKTIILLSSPMWISVGLITTSIVTWKYFTKTNKYY